MADYCKICRKHLDMFDSADYIDFEGVKEPICSYCYFMLLKINSTIAKLNGKTTIADCKIKSIETIGVLKNDKEALKIINKYLDELLDQNFVPIMKADEDTLICTSKIKFCSECGKANNVNNKKCINCDSDFDSVDEVNNKIMEIKYCPNCNKVHKMMDEKCSGCGFQF